MNDQTCRICGCEVVETVRPLTDSAGRAGYCRPSCVARANRKAKATHGPRNARLWVFENDAWVKLTLAAGQSLNWGRSQRDDEGHSWSANRWTHDGDGVRNEWAYGGTDCDGRTSAQGVSFAPLDAKPVPGSCTALEFHNGKLIVPPVWLEVEPVRCRDQFAELANY